MYFMSWSWILFYCFQIAVRGELNDKYFICFQQDMSNVFYFIFIILGNSNFDQRNQKLHM